MESYAHKNNDSPIIAYEILDTAIKVVFRDNDEAYTYSNKKAGKKHVDRMKKLARDGAGLATYISRYVRDLND